METENFIRILSLGSLLFTLIFSISFVLIQILKKELSIKDNFISRYAIGKFGVFLKIGFLSYGVSQILLSLCYLTFNIYFSFVFMLLSGFGMIIVAIFPMDIDNKPTLNGILHFIGAIMYYILLLFSISFAITSLKSKLLINYTFINICILSVLLLLLGLFTYVPKLTEIKIKGLIQKLYFILAILWIIIINLSILNTNYTFSFDY